MPKLVNYKTESLPKQFKEEYRLDLIRRAVVAQRSKSSSPYGAHPTAGITHSDDWHRRRRKKWRTNCTYGISRTPRKILGRIGGGFQNVMRFHLFRGSRVPQAVGGRECFPPKVEKVLVRKINDVERKKAIRSAISATIIKELVEKRGHLLGKLSLPVIFDSTFENMSKTKEVYDLLESVLNEELERAGIKKVRSGKGKVRGRPYKKRKGPLVIVSKDCPVLKAAKNIPGIDVVTVEKLNAEALAPGAQPGRLCVWTESAIKMLEEKKLFM